jgi:hypothetical protein
MFGYEYPMVSVPLELQMLCCVCHHRRWRMTMPLTMPQVRGAGSSTSAYARAPQNETMAKR